MKHPKERQMTSLGIIGFGNMGEAMISGVREQHPELRINVSEKIEPRRKLAVDTYGASDFTDNPAGLFAESEAVIIAIKPQDIPEAAKLLKKHSAGKQIISIAAGMSLERISGLFDTTMVSRFMPSLAASVGKSVTAVCFTEECDPSFQELAFQVAESVGLALEVPEYLIPSIIGISGSGIAFVYEFIQALSLAGVKEGIKFDSSLTVALDVLEGAVSTLRESGLTPGELVTRVCSPGGTTIEGIESLHKNRFTATVMEAVSAAAEKARKLEQ
jgi:pyrroline-5-carboxylate reductase